MSLPRNLHITWSLAAVLLAAAAPGHVIHAETIAGGALTAVGRAPAAGEGAFRHLQALQDIASANGGTRAAGTPGYDRSAEYVAEQLKAAGYAVRFEEFEFPFFEDRTPPVLAVDTTDGARDEVPPGAVRTLTNSGSSDVTAPLRAVKLGLDDGAPAASTSGCDAADFEGFVRGSVALVRRGTCPFQAKVENAVAAGAVGVVIMNEGTQGRIEAFSGLLMKPVAVPVVGIPYERGRSLDMAFRTGAAVGVRLAVDAVAGKRPTRNVLAETEFRGDAPLIDRPLIVVGAHLDSVPEGPGINDNGSGSAAVLEAALQLAPKLTRAPARVRFAFWSAEERGLVGSRHHVDAMSEEERRAIAVYINLDMAGSPNYVRDVRVSHIAGDGLVEIARREFLAEFRAQSLPVEERTGGRFGTDDGSFSQKDIPTVALSTGAGAPKSETQASVFGGVAGRPFDPCYHRACDTTENINRGVLEENTRALVHTLAVVALAAPANGTPSQKAVDLPAPKL
jgi:Zn-dependent M28 family amino/carboxypeptidase